MLAMSSTVRNHPCGVGWLEILGRRRNGDQRHPTGVGMTQQNKHHHLVGFGHWRQGLALGGQWLVSPAIGGVVCIAISMAENGWLFVGKVLVWSRGS